MAKMEDTGQSAAKMSNPDEVADLLKNCLIVVEKQLHQISYHSNKLGNHGNHTSGHSNQLRTNTCITCGSKAPCCHGYNNNNCAIVRPRILPSYAKLQQESGTLERGKGAGRMNTRRREREARAVHKVAPDGRLVALEGTNAAERAPPGGETQTGQSHPTVTGQSHPTVTLPVRLQDVDEKVLVSGAVQYTASKDLQGADTVLIFCQHPAWQAAHFTTVELAKLLLYYFSVTREEDRARGLTVIVDARGTTLPTLNMLLETLYAVQASQPGTVTMTHVLADKLAQSMLFRSSVFRPQVNLRIDLVNSVDTLYKFVPRHGLPPQLGGTYQSRHHSWCRFRKVLEPFLHRCRCAASVLLRAMDDLTATPDTTPDPSVTPDTTPDPAQLLARVTGSGSVAEVREGGERTLDEMRGMNGDLFANEDYRRSLDTAERLYGQLDHTVRRLSQLAHDRLQQLDNCRRQRQHHDRCTEMMTWLTTEGADILRQFEEISDNLKGIRSQKKAFEKVYFTAMSQLEKASDLLEEAKTLHPEGSTEGEGHAPGVKGQAPGVKDISSDLRGHMTSYGHKLEAMREKIDDTSRCYHLLDKSYEWALGAMKHGASIKVDPSASMSSLEDQARSLEVYTAEHPPVTPETFSTMVALARSLGNDKLCEQCEVARSRCEDTRRMLEERARRVEQARRRLAGRVCEDGAGRPGSGPGRPTDTPPRGAFAQHAGDPAYLSQLLSVLRRHSYAGRPSAPLYSPCAASAAAAFRDSDMNLWEYEEYLFSEGLITEDMSDRVVASLPKGLSDSARLRGSRESLNRGSVENLNTSGTPDPPPSRGRTRPPHRKMLKKAASVAAPEGSAMSAATGGDSARERRDNKTISMVTAASTDSLPSMPEEEEVTSHPAMSHGDTLDAVTMATTPAVNLGTPTTPVTITTERKFGWSPVPVNTHLLQQSTLGGPRTATQGVTGASRLSHSQSMADLRVTEEQLKQRKAVAHIIHEMILTERDYVRALQFVIDHYLPELARDDLPQALRGKRNVIFGNLEKIYEFHNTRFLGALEKCQMDPVSIARCFLDHDQEFFLYALYNKNKPKSDILMADYGMAFFKHKQVELGDRLDLSSYLLKPVQRIAKYSLLLRQLNKTCLAGTGVDPEPEHADLLGAAAEMVRFQIRHGNDLLAMDALKACDVNLQEQGMLLRQDEFLVYQGKKKCFRHVFLFEEMVLFSKTKRTSSGSDLYIYKNSIKTSDLGLTETVADYPHKFEVWFRKRTAGDTFVLQAAMLDVKSAWVKEISVLLWKQAFRNRERRLSEAARMGIGRKPCMDLKASKDNIQDRFINVSIASHVPRMRNSIAVSSFDHLRNGAKRPHSLISVSSSSASSSSSSSQPAAAVTTAPTTTTTTQTPPGGGDGPPQSQPPPLAKFYSVTSSESGIEVDLNASVMSATEDACTQTTLGRPKNKSAPPGPDGHSSGRVRLSTADHTLCTDV